jgi:wobble nucleotide-excising tRNase
MIHKITVIKNLGKLKSPNFGKENWNGIFQSRNIIYANNGSGKTTLSLLFRSLRNNNEILIKKKSFNSIGPIEIKLFDSQSKEYLYKKNKWNKHYEKIEVFDSYYVEDNVYVINIKENPKGASIFELLLGEESISYEKEIDSFLKELNKLKNKRVNIRNRKNKSDDNALKKELEQQMIDNSNEKKIVSDKIKLAESKIKGLSEKYKDQYMEKINHYLSFFNPDIKLLKLEQFNTRAVYTLEVMGYTINDTKEYSLRYTLSEGDKSALSFSFFLAKLELKENLSEYTIVIDDPMTSFDYARKSSTINIISKLSNRVKQLIILTHDLKFSFDLYKKFSANGNSCENIKINSNSDTSYFQFHDIERENLSGIFKDITVLNEYISNGAKSDVERREVIRCIRPSIEGIFRIKFFGEIQSNEWLGDIISKIRNSTADSYFYKYRNILDDISEINDYSKEYHHSNPQYLDAPINDSELKIYVTNSLKLIRKI